MKLKKYTLARNAIKFMYLYMVFIGLFMVAEFIVNKGKLVTNWLPYLAAGFGLYTGILVQFGVMNAVDKKTMVNSGEGENEK